MDLALNNLQGLICHKTQQTKPITLVCSRNYRQGMSLINGENKEAARINLVEKFICQISTKIKSVWIQLPPSHRKR